MHGPRRVWPLAAVLVLVLATLALAACDEPTPAGAGDGSSVTVAADDGLRDLIEAMAKPYPPGDARYLSSNAYDYTRDNPAFDATVAKGYDALPGLEEYLRTENPRGLDGYLICIAMEKITRCDLKQFEQFAWADAGGFQVQWNRYLEQMPPLVDAALKSGKSPEDQAQEIAKLGAPAVPYVVDHADSIVAAGGSDMAEALAAILRDAKPGNTVEKFGDNNSDAIAQLRSYVENR
jgi:hypothetical protein